MSTGRFDQPPHSGRQHSASGTKPARSRAAATGDPAELGEIAAQIGAAASLIGGRMERSTAPAAEEVASVTDSFSTAVAGLTEGLQGVTRWLRVSGHAGVLSGRSSAVTDRLAHAGFEIQRLAEVIAQIDQAPGGSSNQLA